MSALPCAHWFRVLERHEDRYRIRTHERCEHCALRRDGILPKCAVFYEGGKPIILPVGEWTYTPASSGPSQSDGGVVRSTSGRVVGRSKPWEPRDRGVVTKIYGGRRR